MLPGWDALVGTGVTSDEAAIALARWDEWKDSVMVERMRSQRWYLMVLEDVTRAAALNAKSPGHP